MELIEIELKSTLKAWERAQALWEKSAKMEYWEKTNHLNDINDQYIKMVTSLVLENQRLYDTAGGGDKNEMAYKLIAKIFPNLLMHKLVSVQPKLGPVSNIHHLQWKIENEEIKENVVSRDVVAVTRRLKAARLTTEDVEDLSRQITEELNTEILNDLTRNCGTVSVCANPKNDDLYSGMCSMAGILHRKIMAKPNWIVVHSKTYDKHNKTFLPFSHTYRIHINDCMKENAILMGRKGDKFYDTGYAYCPYIFITPAPNIPRIGYMTRYGKILLNAKYYGRVEITES